MKTKEKNALKFEMNKVQLSDARINKHKNFNKLMHEYQTATTPLYKTPLYKNKKVFLVVLLIVLIIYLIVESVAKEEKIPAPPNTEQVS